jgi:hypothetical protein
MLNLWRPAFAHVDQLGHVAQPLRAALTLPQEGILWSDSVLGKIEQAGVKAKHSFNTPSPKAKAKRAPDASPEATDL